MVHKVHMYKDNYLATVGTDCYLRHQIKIVCLIIELYKIPVSMTSNRQQETKGVRVAARRAAGQINHNLE